MKRPRKYGPGAPFVSIGELLEFASNGGGMVWCHDRPEHVYWTVNRGAAFLLRQMIPNGAVRRAVVTPEYEQWLRNEFKEITG